MADNNGGPWGSGGNKGGGNQGNNGGNQGGGRGNGPDGPQISEIDELVKKGQDQLRILMGGKGGSTNGTGQGGGTALPRGTWLIAVLIVAVIWLALSLYRVQTSQQSVELLFGEYHQTGTEGLNFAPWPIVTKEIIEVTSERTEEIGVGGRTSEQGLMLTGDENIVDVDFQVVWNISSAEKFLFNLAEPRETIRAVSESVMREIVARTDLTPILTTGKGAIASELRILIQETLDSYDAGVNIVRVNFDQADPPADVRDAFRAVQAAEQTRDTLEKQADAYFNEKVAGARGEAAQLVAQAEGYRSQVVNQAEGEASRFLSVLGEYEKAPDVTRTRLYIETIEKVFGDVDKIILENGGSGVVPYLPLNELRKSTQGAAQ